MSGIELLFFTITIHFVGDCLEIHGFNSTGRVLKMLILVLQNRKSTLKYLPLRYSLVKL